MKIRFVQSGGFTGLVRVCELDTAALDDGQASELKRLVGQAGIVCSGQHVSAQARDMVLYEISIDDGEEIEVTFDDSSVPAQARALIGFLKKGARRV